jgi:D-glycero-alpha-D-manno-heptose 1-phosphate guanylyltransferase
MHVMILSGGLGTRISHILNGKQKCMVEIMDKPFLSYIIKNLTKYKINKITLLLGHASDSIIDYFHSSSDFDDIKISYSIDKQKLGTAGAIKNAIYNVQGENFIALNGDTYTDLNFQSFIDKFKNQKIDFGLCIKKPEKKDSKDYAGIEVDIDGNIVSYKEKSFGSFMSCGIYYLTRKIFYEINEGEEISIENQLIPQLLNKNYRMKSFVYDGPFYDIGTENRLKTFTNYIASI